MGAGQRNPNPGGPSANYGMNMAGGSQGNYRAQMSSNQMNQQNMVTFLYSKFCETYELIFF